MARFPSAAALALLSLAASACNHDRYGLSPAHNPSLTSVNQPVVQRTDFVLDVNAAGNGVPASEQDRLATWFDSLELGYGDQVYVDQAAGYADARARQDVADVAAGYGLLVHDGAPITAGSVQPGSVRVIVSRNTASVPGCPIWQDEIVGAPERTASNYGCAVNSNLAAMVADPNDLVLGQTGSGNGNAATATRAIKTYREKTPTGAGNLKNEKTGGK